MNQDGQHISSSGGNKICLESAAQQASLHAVAATPTHGFGRGGKGEDHYPVPLLDHRIPPGHDDSGSPENGPDHYAHALNYAEIALKILDPGLHSNSIMTNIRE